MNKLRNLFYTIKYKIQRMNKGYSDEDLFCIHDWFTKIFPKMLDDFCSCTFGNPCDSEELKAEVKKFPVDWLEQQIPYFDKLYSKNKDYDLEYDLDNEFCCWQLIILRMKYCFELCDEFNSYYDKYYKELDKLDIETQLQDRIKIHNEIDKEVEKYKEEAFYLFNKWFFNLWW